MMSNAAMINFNYTDCLQLSQLVEGFEFHPVTSRLVEKTAIVERVVKNMLTDEVETIGVRIDGMSHVFLHAMYVVDNKVIFRGFVETEIFQAFYL